MDCPHVKICGITRPEDAHLAADLGADAIGLNFVGGPRKIDKETERQVLLGLARHRRIGEIIVVRLCGVSATEYPGAASWQDFAGSSFNTFQIYGRDYSSLSGAKAFGISWWMVRHVSDRRTLANIAIEYFQLQYMPSALLLDTASKDQLGGTGKSFNWDWIAEAREAGELNGLPPIILAGGLTPDNVAEAIRIARPWAVDVSSGVEVPGKPGIKDPIKVRDFIQAVKGA